jgi:hypothetical protein
MDNRRLPDNADDDLTPPAVRKSKQGDKTASSKRGDPSSSKNRSTASLSNETQGDVGAKAQQRSDEVASIPTTEQLKSIASRKDVGLTQQATTTSKSPLRPKGTKPDDSSLGALSPPVLREGS